MARFCSMSSSIPRKFLSINDVNHRNILGFGSQLAPGHPGFNDKLYKYRRHEIGKLAYKYTLDKPIPNVKYTKKEHDVWNKVLTHLKDEFPKHACEKYLKFYPLFDFSDDVIPQLEDVSNVLHSHSGWRIRPVSGLLHPREFLGGLAYKYFHSTQYVRHSSNPMYTPEPDVCHELIGHIPMLADKDFADFVQSIGKASLEASDEQIWHLTKIYWYMVEFGVIRESESVKAFGAGILSSYGEMAHMASGNAKIISFNPNDPQPKMNYKDGYQQQYFILDTFEDAQAMIEDYISQMNSVI